MDKLAIFHEITKTKPDKERMVLATVVDYSGEGEQSPVGGKILLRADDKPLVSDGVQDWQEGIINNLPGEKELFDMSNPSMVEIELGDEVFEIYLEPVVDQPRLIIFGGGHVAQPLARIGNMTEFEVTVVDDREDLLTRDNFPTAENLVCTDFKSFLERERIRPDDYLVIVTRGHQHDYTVLSRVIDSPANYIGMIGSKRKVGLTFDRLREEKEVDESLIERVYSPIGIDIASETPAEIAVSIMAEIIAVRRGK